MEKKSVVNFSSFYEGNTEKRKPFDKGEIGKPLFKDVKIPNPESVSESKKSEKKKFDKSQFSRPLFTDIVEEEKNTIIESNKPFEKKEFVKPIFRQIYIPEEDEITETKKEEEEEIEVEYPEEVSKIIEEPKVDPAFEPSVDPEEFVIDEPPTEKDQVEEEEFIPSLSNDNNFNDAKEVKEDLDDKYYPVFKEKFENFTFNVMVEGAKLYNTKARLILESEDWNLVFDGEIDETGKCNIPIKKLNILDEGTIGKIRLEVIAENTIFSPWEDDFKVKVDKKVAVQVPKKRLPKEPRVSVKFGKK
jgi:hypothetical protein